MGEEDSRSYLASYWSSYKAYWIERFKNLDKYKQIYSRDKPLPKWTEADVEEFVQSDPVYGPQLQLTREAAKISAAGSLVGAVSTAGVAMKYSKNGLGTLLSFGAGAAFGWVFGKEVANHTLQLYKFDTMDAQIKFFNWWEKKTEGRS
ncbi:hypothetical protein SUGI_0067120 [Cryptomeria japonica]|uniref:succinate dehydrogenase subunit 6, mitochondrial n=1 Tax=Cryptomeria japonica TaxID=3369 RepID=UPI002408EAE8|nr:succinate dehydrogenase subunit 6, mitochondrial [Cryptomeria japonica]GLJ07437.1 hypothetical protein SUGI_0067120 [Cryptomeria japonica]